MDSRRVYFLVELAVQEGRQQEFERLAGAMTAGTRKEPGALRYEWFLSEDGRRCRLLEEYADAGAVQAHLSGAVVQEMVPQLLGAASLTRFEVYGAPDAEAAAALRAFGAEIYGHWKGLGR